jgi:hypothetical protein
LEEVDWMRELYFVSSYRKSIRTIHFQYGFAGKNGFAGKRFILKITSGEITNDVWWEN